MRLILLTLLSALCLYSQEIRFSTMLLDRTSNIELEYKNMISYLEDKTSKKFKFVFNKGYDDLVKKFGEQKIDILALNAIEYVKLKRNFPYANPILSFYGKNKSKFYTCDAITRNENIKDLSKISKDTVFWILESYSTCGYDVVQYIFAQHGYNLKKFETHNVGIDDDVILEVLLHPNNLGFEKSNTIEKYDFFDLNIIKTDFKVPAFSLIVNTHTIDEESIEKIQEVLLNLNPQTNKDDFQIVRNWNFQTQYGSFIPSEKDYIHLYSILHEIETNKDKR